LQLCSGVQMGVSHVGVKGVNFASISVERRIGGRGPNILGDIGPLLKKVRVAKRLFF